MHEIAFESGSVCSIECEDFTVTDEPVSEYGDESSSFHAGAPSGGWLDLRIPPTKMNPEIVNGDLLDQDVDVIVNAWNRNIIPWWLLLPQGVSGAIKRRAGLGPFRELAKHGPIPLGGAVLTGPGRLPFKGIIHVAWINMLWRATQDSIAKSACSAMRIVNDRGFMSVAFPIIGAGSGSYDTDAALDRMRDAFATLQSDARVVVVRFEKRRHTP